MRRNNEQFYSVFAGVKLARDLLHPAEPVETAFKKIVDTLEKHFSTKPSEIVECYKFHSRNRKEDKEVAAYVAELRKLTEHCNFSETLPEMLRDRLVCGINNKKNLVAITGGTRVDTQEGQGDCFGRRASSEASG